MRKYLIAALVLAAGCDATRRDFSVCDSKYKDCKEGFTCNLATERCEPITDASPPVEAGPPDAPPIDVGTGEVAITDAVDAPAIDVTPGEVQPVDVTTPDVPIVTDGPPLDSRVPDAPGTCSIDLDCAGSARPYCVSNQCVTCRTSNHCSNAAGTPFCSAVNTCVSCAAATGDGGICSGTAPICDPGSGRCVECTRNSECPTAAKAFCVANQCVGCNTPGASAGGGGAGGSDGGIRDGGGVEAGAVDGGVVGPCTGSKPFCEDSGTLIGQCVQCRTSRNSADCSGSTPICSSANLCTACTSDSQCASLGTGPGVCMSHQDGRCASEVETIYVKNSASCSGGSGAATSPYCNIQAGIGAVTSSRRLVLVIGGTPLGTWTTGAASLGSQQVSVIGRQDPLLSAGAADVGIRITSGKVYLRGLTLQGAASATVTPSQPGIIVDSGATIVMERCRVFGFAGGLLVNPGANFDITNSIFAANTSGQFGTTTFFGGVYLGGSAPAGGPSRFWFNTVVDNDDRGILCSDATQRLSGILARGNANADYTTCIMDKTSSWASGRTASDGTTSYVGDLSLTSNYHLTTTNHCKDLLDATVPHPSNDIDGDSRPLGVTGKLDCGADEYRQ